MKSIEKKCICLQNTKVQGNFVKNIREKYFKLWHTFFIFIYRRVSFSRDSSVYNTKFSKISLKFNKSEFLINNHVNRIRELHEFVSISKRKTIQQNPNILGNHILNLLRPISSFLHVFEPNQYTWLKFTPLNYIKHQKSRNCSGS